MATRTLTFTPWANVAREAVTRTVAVGRPAFFHGFNLNSRPFYKFTLQLGPLFKSEAECLSALHAFHQGTTFFLYNGGPYGGVDDYVFIGVGDGNRLDYFLPNRHIGPNSFAVQTFRPSTGATSQWSTGFSLAAGPGLVFFGTSPRSGDHVQARYGCQYLCNFAPDGITLEQVAKDLYTADLTLIENPDPILQTVTEVMTQATPFEESLAARARLAAAMTIRVPLQHITMAVGMRTAANISPTVTAAGGGQGRLAVDSGDTEATVATGLPNSVGFTMAPEWNTTWWVTSKGSSAVHLGFGTQVASGGSYINWGTFSL